MQLQILRMLTDDLSLTLEKLSASLGLRRKEIQLLVKNATGMSFREARKNCRLCHSVSLLESGVSVKEAAFDCGYSYPQDYSRALKKHLGISPSVVLKRQMGEEGGGRLFLPAAHSMPASAKRKTFLPWRNACDDSS
jgi:AraC-like DNA-binding protein